MHRRTFLQFMGAAGFGLRLRELGAVPAPRRIAVVGAGIVGASIACRLAQRGADVTVLEKAEPASGATRTSFAWINAHFSKQPRSYHLLNQLGVAAYLRLEQELSGPGLVRWGGSLEWHNDAKHAGVLRAEVRRVQEWGYPARLISPEEFAALEPQVAAGEIRAAVFFEQEGAVDAAQIAQLLLRKAAVHGARTLHPCEVTGMDLRGGRLRALITTRGEIEADCAVLAAGVDTPRLAQFAGLAVPLRHAPGLLAWTEPLPPTLQRVAVAPRVHFRQLHDGRILIGEDDGPPAGQTHAHLASGPQDFPNDTFRELHAAALRRLGTTFLPVLARTMVRDVRIGWRPMPQDGLPIVGAAAAQPDVYLAVTHSGVTLGPLLGQLAAAEILDGVRVDLLEPFRLERFSRP